VIATTLEILLNNIITMIETYIFLVIAFGKPKETIENINIDAGKLTDEEIKKINGSLEQSY